MHTITFNQKSATGYVRFSNEDSHAVIHATRQSGALAVVCDGMGGAAGGEIAGVVLSSSVRRSVAPAARCCSRTPTDFTATATCRSPTDSPIIDFTG